MHEEQLQQQAEAVEPTADEHTAGAPGAAAEREPEVPDDARATIERAREHIDNLDMQQEREAAKRAM